MTQDRDFGLLFVSAAELSDDDALLKLQATFNELMLGEIRRAIEARLGVASMILLVCAIDFLGSLYAGADATGNTFRVHARVPAQL